jgi:hypothetical protein
MLISVQWPQEQRGQSGGASSRPKLTRSVPNGDSVDPAVVEIAWSVKFYNFRDGSAVFGGSYDYRENGHGGLVYLLILQSPEPIPIFIFLRLGL